MNTTKKNGFLKAAGLMLVVMMLATCVFSGTMAKYSTSSGDLAVSAQVAKWSIMVGSQELKELSADDLKFTIYDTDGDTTNTDANVTTDMIAPGTWGFASVEITNKSNVDAKVTANYRAGSTTLPKGMTVAVLDEAPTSPTQVTGGSSGSSTVSATLDKDGGTTTSTSIVIAFKWDFADGVNDLDDTPFGEKAEKLSLRTLTITADQVD